MKNLRRRFGVLLLATIAWTTIACGDDGTTTSTGASGSSSSSSGAGGSGGMGGSGGAGGAGGSGGAGQAKPTPGTELVSGGDVVKSSKFKMVITVGGSTPAPGAMQSPKNRLRGGLVGVTEGAK